MLRELKQLDDDLGITVDFKIPKRDEKQIKRERRDKLLDEIWEKWPRKTLLNKDVLQMRGNALKNPVVKALLEETHKRIEDCALVKHGSERHNGSKYEHECPGNTSPEAISDSLQKWQFENTWNGHFSYYWGSPKDRIKILFKKSDNNRFRAIGLIQMFPEKKVGVPEKARKEA